MAARSDGGRVFVVRLYMQVASGRGVAAVERTNSVKAASGSRVRAVIERYKYW